MPAILIDYKKISDTAPPPPKSTKDFKPRLLVITEHINIDDPRFADHITGYHYVMYNEKKGICLLNSDIFPDIKDCLNALFSGLDKDVVLWISIELEQSDFISSIRKLASSGFNSPYMTNMSPLRVNIHPSIAMVRQNTPTEQYDEMSTLNKVLHAIEQYKDGNKSCSLSAKISKRAVSFLRKTSKIGFSDDGSQKELTGELYVSNVKKSKKKFIYIIDVNESSVESGNDEDVDVSATRYNFHSHPQQAYIRHSVDKAWPSLTDYLGYLQLGINTIFHCVATLEGIYIMSFGSYWGNKLKKVSKKFIEDKYDIDHKEKYTPEQYVKKVNKILYKKYPIYNLQFFPWDKAGKVFNISYAKIGLSCIATEKGSQIYKKIHS